MTASEMMSIIMPPLSPMIAAGESVAKAAKAQGEKGDALYISREKRRKAEYAKWKAILSTLAATGIIPRDARDAYIYYQNRDLIMDRGKNKK